MSSPSLEYAPPSRTRIASEQISRRGRVFRELTRTDARIDPAIVALTILAVGVAFYRIGAKSLWYDETVSAGYASLDLTHLWKQIIDSDPNMGLYYVLLHFWARIFGYTETALRSLTVVLGALTVPITVLIGRRLISRPAGLVAGLLLAVSPFLVQYEQTARSYAVVVMLVAVSWYFFVAALDHPSPRAYVGYTLAIALAIIAQYVAGYVLLVQFLTLVAIKRRAVLTRSWLIVWIALGAACAAVAVIAIPRAAEGISYLPDPAVRKLFGLPLQLAGGRVLGIVLVILACYGVFRVCAARPRWRGGLLVTWCFGPVLLAFTASKLVQPNFKPQYLIIVLPAFLLLAAAGLVQLPRRATQLAVLCLLVVLSAIGISNWYTAPSSEDYRTAVRYVLAHQRPGDGIICLQPHLRGLTLDDCWGVSYYEKRAGRTGPISYYDSRTGEIYPLTSPPGRHHVGTTQALRPPRFWLLMHGNASPRLQSELERGIAGSYRRVAIRRSFRGMTVILYRAPEES